MTITGKLGAYVYQRVAPGLGNVPDIPSADLQKRLWVKSPKTSSPALDANRAKFAAGVTAWRNASAETIAQFEQYGSDHGLSGYNAFISWWLRHN